MEKESTKNLESRINKLLQEAREFYEGEEIEEQLKRVKNEITDFIRKNPLQCVAGGFLAGYIIARLLRSDND